MFLINSNYRCITFKEFEQNFSRHLYKKILLMHKLITESVVPCKNFLTDFSDFCYCTCLNRQ